ncbi:MAG TPA: ATP-dependent endonuclease [Oculatellaceae cyanobacterium]
MFEKRRTATDAEFWTAIQRLWTFEEPHNRWIRLLKNLSRLRAQTGLDVESISTQESLFAGVYGLTGLANTASVMQADCGSPRQVLNAFFSAGLALRELMVFQESAFDFCRSRLREAPVEQKSNEFVKSLLSGLNEYQLEPEQFAFIAHRVVASPDWFRLLQPGEWTSDTRAEFVTHVLQHSESTLNSTKYSAIGDNFRQFNETFVDVLAQRRSSLPPGFLPNRVILVEGATEQILLPHFARCLHAGWNERAILVQPVGGANQLTKRYPALRASVKIPIDCVLDGDVESQAQAIAAVLKNGDRLFVLEGGAIEEKFPRELIVDLTNAYFAELGGEAIYAEVTAQDLIGDSNQDSLERLWRKRNRGTFDKTGFARIISENVCDTAKIPLPIKELIAGLSK